MPDEPDPAAAPDPPDPPAPPPPPSSKPRIPLSPRARKLVAFAILAAGAVVVGQTLAPAAPRDVEVAVRLARFREAPDTARSITVEFERGGSVVRTLTERFGGRPPIDWHQVMPLPPGPYAATVRVELEGRSAVGQSRVDVAAGERLELPPPRVP